MKKTSTYFTFFIALLFLQNCSTTSSIITQAGLPDWKDQPKSLHTRNFTTIQQDGKTGTGKLNYHTATYYFPEKKEIRNVFFDQEDRKIGSSLIRQTSASTLENLDFNKDSVQINHTIATYKKIKDLFETEAKSDQTISSKKIEFIDKNHYYETVTDPEKGKTKSLITRDGKGNITNIVRFDENDAIQFTVEQQFNSQNKITESFTYSGPDKRPHSLVTNIKYDANGNLLSRDAYTFDPESGEKKFKDNNSVSYLYDDRKNVIKETFMVNGVAIFITERMYQY
ncbi:hypothetical protein [Chryseobacterium koreense]|uniref:hypothetical protein n=1 Tax=Chryseobacterium koreense TaxID=232216 RepID=UPI0026F08779|nr:hypothetical protein [Chryseobacterium koreense]